MGSSLRLPAMSVSTGTFLARFSAGSQTTFREFFGERERGVASAVCRITAAAAQAKMTSTPGLLDGPKQPEPPSTSSEMSRVF